MKKQIEEMNVKFENGKVKSVAVLWNDGDEARGSYADTKPKSGYFYLRPNLIETNTIVLQVANAGQPLKREEFKKHFTTKRTTRF